MRRIFPIIIAVVVAQSLVPLARGQEVEVTPFGGLGFGGTFELEEALALPVLVDSDTRRLFCVPPTGRCLVTVTDVSALYQGSLSGGLILSF